MKSKKTPLALILATGIFLSSCSFFNRQKSMPVITVNDSELTTSDFADALAQKMKAYDAIGAKSPQNLHLAKESILEEFLHNALVNQWAKKNNVSISTGELNGAVDSYRKQYPDDLAMKQALSDAGVPYEKWRSGIEKLLLEKKVFESLKSKVAEPTEGEMKSYYENNQELFIQKAMIRVRQIVFSTEDPALRLYDQLNKKSDFAELAKKFSIAPEATNGGDTGWIAKGTLEIFDKAFSWPIGKRSPVLKSPYGYHIFEVLGKKSESQLNFQDARASISKLMRADREQAAYSAWLEDQIKQAHVSRNDELINSITVITRGEQ